MAKKIEALQPRPNRALVAVGLMAVFAAGCAVGVFIGYGNRTTNAAIIATNTTTIANTDTCGTIETLLSDRLDDGANAPDPSAPSEHFHRAQVYAALAKYGCDENIERYKALAVHEIEIARALSYDRPPQNYEIAQAVETYKNLDMETEARQFIDTVKKVTGPAVEFFKEIEKILEE